ncbi:histidine--tRNA ligase [bacterium]|nr:histidine--tRNA ligase [bacterium]
MTKIEPRLPKGMRDLGPDDMIVRNKVLACIRTVFERYGYLPLETPALEYWEVLTGKYGEEAERLVYNLTDHGGRRLGLRYDLTVPLARFVASQKQLLKPFKRYQIQPVWRAEKPQKGRFREFSQCDVDVVGSASMLVDSELIAMTVEVISLIGLDHFEVRLNNRKVLQGMVQYAGIAADRTADVCQTLDKADKVSRPEVEAELGRKGYSTDQIGPLVRVATITGDNQSVLEQMTERLHGIDIAREGIDELAQIMSHLEQMGVDLDRVRIVPQLTRGLDYYTGPVYETFLTDRSFSSLGGGGRYNGLIGIFSDEEIPAAGTSFGLDRITTVLQETMTDQATPHTDILVAHFGADVLPDALRLVSHCRRAGFRTELFFDEAKLKKQFTYADQRNIPVVLLIGQDEARKGTIQCKILASGQQQEIAWADLVRQLQNLLQK